MTSPPTTSVPFPDIDEVIDDLENFIEEGEAGFEEFRSLLDRLRSGFFR